MKVPTDLFGQISISKYELLKHLKRNPSSTVDSSIIYIIKTKIIGAEYKLYKPLQPSRRGEYTVKPRKINYLELDNFISCCNTQSKFNKFLKNIILELKAETEKYNNQQILAKQVENSLYLVQEARIRLNELNIEYMNYKRNPTCNKPRLTSYDKDLFKKAQIDRTHLPWHLDSSFVE